MYLFVYSFTHSLFINFQEDELDILPIGRLSRDSAIFRNEGGEGILSRELIMGKF